MIFTLIILLIVIILVWYFIPKNTNNNQKSNTNNSRESYFYLNPGVEIDYDTLKKVFFYPSIQVFNFDYRKRYNKVYGVLIEQIISDDNDENRHFMSRSRRIGKLLFASYITGFTGNYDSFGNGYIGGKFYSQDDMNVQREVMDLYYGRNLDGLSQNNEIRKLSTRLVLKANKLIDYTVRDVNGRNWMFESEKIKIYLLTKNGEYFAEVIQSEIHNSIWQEIIEDSQNILKLLGRENIKFNIKVNKEDNTNDLPF
jgi:hypothetical protein